MGEEIGIATDIGREMLWIALKVGAPILLIGLAVGLAAAFFQALTSMSDMTLSFVPKLLGTLLGVALLLPWVLIVLSEYAEGVFGTMTTWFP